MTSRRVNYLLYSRSPFRREFVYRKANRKSQKLSVPKKWQNNHRRENFPYSIDPFSEGEKSILIVAYPENVSIPL